MRQYLLRKQKEDSRDLRHFTALIKKQLPTSVDLRNKMPPVFDQGSLGSCSANAGVAARMVLSGVNTLLSRLFLYYQERFLENSTQEDSGAQMRDICKALQKYGVCEESYSPYKIENFKFPPSVYAIQNAKNYTISAYKSLNTLDEIKTYLAEKQLPVLIGMSVYESMESDKVAKTGKLPLPKKGEQELGGHAVLAVGYDDAKKVLIVRNSWGEGWGDKGYFYMPYSYVTKSYAFDFWVIE